MTSERQWRWVATVGMLGMLSVARAGTLVSGDDQPSGDFGAIVATAPDLTGDGRADVVAVGQYELVNQEQNEFGKAHCYDGVSEGYRFTFPTVDSQGTFIAKFSSVVGIGDITGDGRSDVIMGTQDKATVRVFNGTTGALYRTIIDPPVGGGGSSYFGSAMAALPDRNGDGFPEFAVGAVLGADQSGKYPDGFVDIISGASGLRVGRLRPPGAAGASSGFGYTVAAANTAAIAGMEVVVGAVNAMISPWPNAGRVHIYSGTDFLRSIESPNPTIGAYFGWDIFALRVTGSELDEIVISSPGETSEAGKVFYAGRVYVFGAGTTPRLELESPQPEEGAHFGNAVAVIEDVTGDHSPDIAVGAPVETVGKVGGAGRVHLYDGMSGGFVRTIVSPQPSNSGAFGTDIAPLPDQDGDGFGDLVVGAPGDEFGNGRVYIISGASGLPTEPSLIQSVVNLVDGVGTTPAGLNLNADDCVDVADVLAAVQ